MNSLVHLFFVACTFLAIAVAQECGTGWVQNGQSCYLLTDEHLPDTDGPARDMAQRICMKRKNGALARIDDEDENIFLKSWLATEVDDSTAGVWIDEYNIGVYPRPRGGILWRPKKIKYSDWTDTPEASGFCVSMIPKHKFTWDMIDCDNTTNMKYVCEKPFCNQPTECFQGSCYTLHCSDFKGGPPKMRKWDIVPIYGPTSLGLPIKTDITQDLKVNYYPENVCPQGSHLVRIESEEENEFLKKFLAKSEDFVQYVWTAAYRDEDEKKFRWQGTEEQITGFTDFTDPLSRYYKERGCVALSRSSGWKWLDTACRYEYPILCEAPDTSKSG